MAEFLGSSDLGLLISEYAWFMVPVALSIGVALVVVLKALPRQRRREDLSGEDHRPR
jgi:hypothetical protein